MWQPIIDSSLSEAEGLRDSPLLPCPPDIFSTQRLLDLRYWSLDDHIHQGQLVVHEDLAQDMQKIFAKLLDLRFPIAKMIPIADPRYAWDDNRSMADDNTSAFNYRIIAETDKLSWHAYGRAIDINPRRNPYVKNGTVAPQGALYDSGIPGTLTNDSPAVNIFRQYGFVWGGEWTDRKDYQHFEKPFST